MFTGRSYWRRDCVLYVLARKTRREPLAVIRVGRGGKWPATGASGLAAGTWFGGVGVRYRVSSVVSVGVASPTQNGARSGDAFGLRRCLENWRSFAFVQPATGHSFAVAACWFFKTQASGWHLWALSLCDALVSCETRGRKIRDLVLSRQHPIALGSVSV